MLNKMFVLCSGCQRSIFADTLAGAVIEDQQEYMVGFDARRALRQ